MATLLQQINTANSNVVNGKTAIATAITNKGVSTANNATFSTMAANINAIPSGSKKYGVGDVVDMACLDQSNTNKVMYLLNSYNYSSRYMCFDSNNYFYYWAGTNGYTLTKANADIGATIKTASTSVIPTTSTGYALMFNNGYLYACNALNLYKLDTDFNLVYSINFSATNSYAFNLAFNGDDIYIPSVQNKNVKCYSNSTNALKWTSATLSAMVRFIFFIDGYIYCLLDSYVVKLNPADGTTMWTTPTGYAPNTEQIPYYKNGYLYYYSSSYSAMYLTKINVSTGAVTQSTNKAPTGSALFLDRNGVPYVKSSSAYYRFMDDESIRYVAQVAIPSISFNSNPTFCIFDNNNDLYRTDSTTNGIVKISKDFYKTTIMS